MSLSKNVCVRVRVHVSVCARACVSVCVCARAPLCVCLGLSCESACFWFCLCARARESVCESACVRACCTYVCVCSTCVCLCLGATALCWPSRGTAGTGGIYSSASGDADGPHVRAALAIGRFARVHAGATWTSRTASAPWAARQGHTTVIDAAGAIYVIGGTSSAGSTCNRDVWASTDGGADRTRAGWSGGRERVLRGTTGVLQGYIGVLRVLRGYSRGTRDASGVLQGYSRSTLGGTRGELG
jgi:hypothetical protein